MLVARPGRAQDPAARSSSAQCGHRPAAVAAPASETGIARGPVQNSSVRRPPDAPEPKRPIYLQRCPSESSSPTEVDPVVTGRVLGVPGRADYGRNSASVGGTWQNRRAWHRRAWHRRASCQSAGGPLASPAGPCIAGAPNNRPAGPTSRTPWPNPSAGGLASPGGLAIAVGGLTIGGLARRHNSNSTTCGPDIGRKYNRKHTQNDGKHHRHL